MSERKMSMIWHGTVPPLATAQKFYNYTVSDIVENVQSEGKPMIRMDQAMVIIARGWLERLDPSERLEFIARILEGYCPDCGMPIPGKHCFCQADE